MANPTIPNKIAHPTAEKGSPMVFCTFAGSTDTVSDLVLDRAAGFVPESVTVRVTVKLPD